jgi:hypothetical protein
MKRFSRFLSAVIPSALIASAMTVAPAGADSEVEHGVLYRFGDFALDPVIDTADAWAAFGGETSRGNRFAISKAGKLIAMPGIASAISTPSPAVQEGTVVQATVDQNNTAWARLSDGTVHKWGGQRQNNFEDRVWTPTEIGGRAVDVSGGINRVLILLEDGTASFTDAFDTFLLKRNGNVIQNIKDVERDYFVTTAGDLGVIDSLGAVSAWRDAGEDPVVSVNGNAALTQSGKVLMVLPNEDVKIREQAITGLQEGETAVDAMVMVGTFIYVKTSKGRLLTQVVQGNDWSSTYDAPDELQEAIDGGRSFELLPSANSQVAIWLKPASDALDPLTVLTQPEISGTPRVGATLTATAATFSDDEITLTHRWFADDDLIDGADEDSLELTSGMVDKTITYTTTAYREADDTTLTSDDSNAIGPVKAAQVAPSISLSAAKATYGKAANVTVKVKGGTGKVTLKNGSTSLGSKNLSSGKATFSLPAKTKPGKYTLKAEYAGNASLLASSKSLSVTVAKASPKAPSVKVSKVPTRKKTGKLTVTVAAPGSGLAKPSGKVKITVKGVVKKTFKVKLKNGKVSVKLPKASKKGKFTITTSYAGDTYYSKASGKKATTKVKK